MKPVPLSGCYECRDKWEVVTNDNVALCKYHANVYEVNEEYPRWKPFTIGQTVKVNRVPALWAWPVRFRKERLGIVLEVSNRSNNEIIYALLCYEKGHKPYFQAWFEHDCLTFVSDVTKESLKVAMKG